MNIISLLSLILLFQVVLFIHWYHCLFPFSSHSSCSTCDNLGHRAYPFLADTGPIDIVYTWVNGTDPRWLSEKSYYQNGNKEKSAHHDNNRYRDNEELRFSLRSIEMYAPWVRHIFLVTDGQVPSWLNIENDRITIIQHATIFNNISHLPVFSSPSIESHLNSIPDLSEHFLYFNDDVFLGAPVFPHDWMVNGIPKVYLAWEVPECAEHCPESLLGDGICDMACNTTMCDYDMQDCGCQKKEDGHVMCDKKFVKKRDEWKEKDFKKKRRREWWGRTKCAHGCRFTQIGDGFCDFACNNLACGYDGHDCHDQKAIHNDNEIPMVILHVDQKERGKTLQKTIIVSSLHSSVWINFKTLWGQKEDEIVSVSHGLSPVLKRAVFNEEDMNLLLLFGKNKVNQHLPSLTKMIIVGTSVEDGESTVELLVVRGGGPILSIGDTSAVLGVYTPTPFLSEYEDDFEDRTFLPMDKIMNVEAAFDASISSLEVQWKIPLHELEDWSVGIVLNSTLRIKKSTEWSEDLPMHALHFCVPVLEAFVQSEAAKKDPYTQSLLVPCRSNNAILQFNQTIPINGRVLGTIDEGILEGEICMRSITSLDELTLDGKVRESEKKWDDDDEWDGNENDLSNELANNRCIALTVLFGTVPIVHARLMTRLDIYLAAQKDYRRDFTWSNMTSTAALRWQYHICLASRGTLDDVEWQPFLKQKTPSSEDLFDDDMILDMQKKQAEEEASSELRRLQRLHTRSIRNCRTRIASQARITTARYPLSWQQWLLEKINTVLRLPTLERDTQNALEDCNDRGDDREQPKEKQEEQFTDSLDTFGDSLRFVNKLYNRAYGKPTTNDRRRIPSHMPHLISKSIMKESKLLDFSKIFQALIYLLSEGEMES